MGQHSSPGDGALIEAAAGIWSWYWWRDALERAFRTALAVLLAAWGGQWTNIYSLGWDQTWRMVVGVTIITLVFAFVAAPVGQRGSAAVLPGPRRQ
jgi:hypothetical protein